MAYGRKWRPSKTQAREFASTMNDLEQFCNEKGIRCSSSMDSYYFTIGDQKYRVSNHTIAKSNSGAYRDGVQVRDKYHEDEEEEDTIYITAGKTRIKEIYELLEDGVELTRRGYRK